MPGYPSTLVDLLRERADQPHDQGTYIFLEDGERTERRLSHAELDRRARAVAAHLREQGIRDGRALILYPPGTEYLVAFFGCLYAGLVAVPVYPPQQVRGVDRLLGIARDAAPTVALASQSLRAALGGMVPAEAIRGLRWYSVEEMGDDGVRAWEEPRITAESLAFLQYTSGSTGTPKGVMLTHANLLHNQWMIREGCGHTEETVFAGWLPLYHDMGLIGNVMHPLYLGVPCVLMSPTHFLQRPARWLEAITRYRATTSGGPNFAYDYCVARVSEEERAALDLASWTIAFNGAEPVRAATMKRFADAFALCGFRPEAFYPCYGLAESSLYVTGGRRDEAPVVGSFRVSELEKHRVVEDTSGGGATTLVASGRSLAGQTVVIADPESGARRAEDEVGEIWIAGPSVALGYWNRPAETVQAFRAHLAETDEGPFLRTGDLGFLRRGELFVTGRLKDLVIIRGVNHYPQDIEQTAEKSHPAIRPGSGAAFPVDVAGEERLVVVHEVRAELDLEEAAAVTAAIRRAVTEAHELDVHAVELLRPGAVPKTSSGKIQRHAARAGFLAGTLDALHRSRRETPSVAGAARVEVASWAELARMSPLQRREAVGKFLAAEACEVLGVSLGASDVEAPLTAHGLDSLRAVELAHRVETRLGVELSLARLLAGGTLGALADYLADQIGPSVDDPASPVAAAPPPGEYPLSWGQRALWFLHQVNPEGGAYNLARALQIDAAVDVSALRAALRRLVERHPALRTTFRGDTVQVVGSGSGPSLEWSDLRDTGEALQARLSAETHRPFDLEGGPLMRVHLFSVAEEKHVLLVCVHHIVVDLWSLALLVEELSALYRAESAGVQPSLAPHRATYAQHVAEEDALLGSHRGEALWRYWRERLGTEAPTLRLPTDRPRPVTVSDAAGAHAFALSAETARRVTALARSQGTTPYVVLLSAFSLVVGRIAGQEHFVVGTPMANRRRAAMAGVVGHFVNSVCISADLSGNPSFAELVDRFRATVTGALEHQEMPLAALVSRLQPSRDPGRTPLFDVMFAYQSLPRAVGTGVAALALGVEAPVFEWGGVPVAPFALRHRSTPFDLLVSMAETGETLSGVVEYRSTLFDEGTVRRMAEQLVETLDAALADPGSAVRLAVASTATVDDHGGPVDERPVHQRIEEWAASTPDAEAVVTRAERLTYGQLDRRANRLAHRLRALGVGTETVVGLASERTAEMLVGVLGILKAGGAYLPLDPGYPLERIALMLEDASPRAVVAEAAIADRYAHLGLPIVPLEPRDEAGPEWGASPGPALPDALAYVMYTSGSTGRPKGVEVAHRSVANLLRCMQRHVCVRPADRVLALTTLSFDMSVVELFLPLAEGASVVLVDRWTAADDAELARTVREERVTVMQATPTSWRMLLRAGWSSGPGQRMIAGGEKLTPELALALLGGGGRLWNAYGPTETTVYAAIHEVAFDAVRSDAASVPIGHAVDRTELHVLDERLDPVPCLGVGQLYVGGATLARGYRGRPDLTADRFVATPLGRLYRTGDLVRMLPTGVVEFLGRADDQLKIRGARVEPGEIETALRSHPGVHDAAVVLRTDPGGHPCLVAYTTPVEEDTGRSELHEFLRRTLPEYMVPSRFVVLDAFPRTPSGKVDRQALPDPDYRETGRVHHAPQTPTQRAVAAVWQAVLGVERVGLDDNFFALGGHSLLMGSLRVRLEETFERALPMIELFRFATVRALAAYLDGEAGPAGDDSAAAEQLGMGKLRRQRRLSLQQSAPGEEPGA
jgi:amino acid adenylation domain-containing protein